MFFSKLQTPSSPSVICNKNEICDGICQHMNAKHCCVSLHFSSPFMLVFLDTTHHRRGCNGRGNHCLRSLDLGAMVVSRWRIWTNLPPRSWKRERRLIGFARFGFWNAAGLPRAHYALHCDMGMFIASVSSPFPIHNWSLLSECLKYPKWPMCFYWDSSIILLENKLNFSTSNSMSLVAINKAYPGFHHYQDIYLITHNSIRSIMNSSAW